MVGAQRDNRKLLAAHELARVLNVPVSWVRVRSHPGASNRLPVVKVGKYVRFDLDEVLCWLRDRGENKGYQQTS